ncbi:MAG: putative RNA-binding protein, eukaryotic snRNP family [Candidatus Nanosalina sp. J07AB43]|nr:MAG: putative RNA-binding protein, eukaryotic snRNP family [Candidatus Nanosalina sp. J07AB43]
MELTSLDLSILEKEFSRLEDGHVQKVYQRGEELTIEIYVPGEDKERLLIGTDRAFITKYKRDNPTRPPGFCMELRKHLGHVEEIKQRGFDRILEIKSGDTKLICELFGKGNFILTKKGKIIGALREEKWADREIRVGLEYQYPEATTDPRKLDDIFKEIQEGEIVREIASKLSFGGTYAEEVLKRANIDKETHVEQLDDERKDIISEKTEDMLNSAENPDPILYVDGEEPVRSSPFPLERYADDESIDFDTFSEAIDEYYYRKKALKEKKEKEEAYQEKKQGIERQKQQQERKIQGLEKSAEQNREKAERIYENYQLLQRIKRQIENSLDEDGWEQTRQKLEKSESEDADKVASLNKQEDFISVDTGEENLKVYLFQDLEATASQYYDKAKNSEEKIESAKEALKETKKELEDLKKEEINTDEVLEDKTQKRKKKWFEKYRWFYSSEDYLVLCGRDAQTNDMLVKKHMESNDLYFHADFDGAPSVVIKDGQEAGEQTRKEAAKAAITFSKTWKAGIGADTAYYVEPGQVTQNPESGEYLQKGAFVIRGDREYMRNTSVEAYIGTYEIEDGKQVPMVGPQKAVEGHCSKALKLVPGRDKKSDIAKTVQSRLNESLDLDYIIRSLPPGKSDIES